MENKEKRPKVYKYQQINGSEDEKERPKIYKHQQINKSDNKKRQYPTNYNSDRYIPLLFSLKVSKWLSNLSKKTKNLTYFISI